MSGVGRGRASAGVVASSVARGDTMRKGRGLVVWMAQLLLLLKRWRLVAKNTSSTVVTNFTGLEPSVEP
jgi:hypothetical protein